MVWNDWLLALHLLSAFAMVAAMVVFWVIVVVTRGSDLPGKTADAARLLPIGSILIVVGSVGTIVLGVWLAIALDDVKVWDGWVIAAIVLWAVAAETGRRGGNEFNLTVARANELVAAGQTGPDARLQELARSRHALALQIAATAATLLILVDMVWKPGGMIASSARDVPLFVHLLGAMILVGGTVTAAGSLLVARGSVQVLRIGYFSLLAVALPGYVIMRVGAEWLFAREHLDDLDSDPTWIGIGYAVADIGALLLLIALLLGGIGVRRLASGRTRLVRASLVISVILLVAFAVTIWAMGAKPA